MEEPLLELSMLASNFCCEGSCAAAPSLHRAGKQPISRAGSQERRGIEITTCCLHHNKEIIILLLKIVKPEQ